MENITCVYWAEVSYGYLCYCWILFRFALWARGWNISVLNLIGVEWKCIINTAVVGRELDPWTTAVYSILVPSGLRVSLEIFVVLNQSNWCTSAFQDIKRLLRFLSKENKRTAICTFYQWHCNDRRRNWKILILFEHK